LAALLLSPLPAAAATTGAPDADNAGSDFTRVIDPYILQAKAQQTLDSLIAAYKARNPTAFMAYVAPTFRGGEATLRQALRRDFLSLDDVELKVTVTGASASPAGGVELTALFQRSVISNKDGRSYKDSGLTQLLFETAGGEVRLVSMKYPLLFGLSDAGRLVESGIVTASDNTQVIVLQQGRVAVVSFQQAVQDLNR
jgi:hypothetical protein